MRRYVAFWPRHLYIEDEGTPTEYDTAGQTMTVHSREYEAYDTGLFDSDGTPIISIDETEPVGFHLNQWAK